MNELAQVIAVDETKCVNCHTCIDACPVKYCIDGSGDTVSINHQLCIGCGNCIEACTHDARLPADNFDAFISALQAGQKVVAIAAPAVASNFPGSYLQLNGYLKSLGLADIFDVSFGAELTVKSYLQHVAVNSPEVIIAQPCPAIVTYCEIYQPELLPHLAPAHSPMLHTIQMIKSFFPEYSDYKVAVLSPCLAKRREFDETGLGDYNVTYKMINQHLKDQNINLDSYQPEDFATPLPERAVLFSTPGGLKQTVMRENGELESAIRKIEGPEIIYDYLKKLPEMLSRGMNPLLVDCLNCELGCNGGPGTLNQGKSPDEVEFYINQRRIEMQVEYEKGGFGKADLKKRVNKVLGKYWKPGIYDRTYIDRSSNNTIRAPNNQQLQEIYQSMHKYEEADFYNCSACGYHSCENMAKAIFNGLNKAENCHYYKHRTIEMEHEAYEQISTRLHLEIEKSTALIEGIKESLETVNEKSQGQYASLEQSSASVEEMVSSIGSASKIASDRQAAVSELISMARKGGKDLNETVSGIEGIAKSVANINEMINVINNVASSTNLLSINAAIEAAHAGDSGRGFSVVAEEIRKLAETTAENSRTISITLKTIISGITDASEKSKATGSTVTGIIDEILEVTDSLNQLTDSMHEMSLGSGQIIDAITHLKDISYQVKDSYSEMSSSMTTMGDIISTINAISNENVDNLQKVTAE
ncbi:MAG: 4Fe-4S binding protein [Spirochaetales bacterium]|jgi:iron only hydrogenase large subunit-like protein|nr:4Fe-4S binding protein [Spirochaetales bacterium]